MAKCRVCENENPVGVERCEKCGTWVDPKFNAFSANTGEPKKTPPAPETFDGRLLGLLEQGRKIEAIKLYREKKGVDLKAAKDAVEALAKEYGVSAKSGSGCAGVVLAALSLGGLLGAGVWFFVA